jgi:hypothetical protein
MIDWGVLGKFCGHALDWHRLAESPLSLTDSPQPSQ